MSDLRHRWFPVEEDLRRSVLERRRQLWRCRKCGVYRTIDVQRRRTAYGYPYKKPWQAKAPVCTPQAGSHQYLEDVE